METYTKYLLLIAAALQAAIFFHLFNLTPEGGNFVSVRFQNTITLPGQPHVTFRQYSGYVPVDYHNTRYLFFYFVEAESSSASKPVVLWLNGPGCSSLLQAFKSNGPFTLTKDGLVKNPHSWNQVANMLYLESPVGVGFTYSLNSSDRLANDERTTRDNLAFLQKWFKMFPRLRKNSFFIVGEGYAGHFVPQLANLILQTKYRINLKGIAIANPLLDFNTNYNSVAEFFWSHAAISEQTFNLLTKVCNFSQIKREHMYGGVRGICKQVFFQFVHEVGDFRGYTDALDNICNSWKLDFDIPECVNDFTFTYLNRRDVQDALRAGLFRKKSWSYCTFPDDYDFHDYEIPMISMLGTLVKSGLRVLAYSGELFFDLPYTGTQSLVKQLAEDIGLNLTLPHRAWGKRFQTDGWIEGYGDGVLSFAVIKGSGHGANSHPERSLLLLKAFLEGKQAPTLTYF